MCTITGYRKKLLLTHKSLTVVQLTVKLLCFMYYNRLQEGHFDLDLGKNEKKIFFFNFSMSWLKVSQKKILVTGRGLDFENFFLRAKVKNFYCFFARIRALRIDCTLLFFPEKFLVTGRIFGLSKAYHTRSSQAVPHPSTILARRCLTAVI